MVKHSDNSKRASDKANQTQLIDSQSVKSITARTSVARLVADSIAAGTIPSSSANTKSVATLSAATPEESATYQSLRRMASATLLGQHTFQAQNGQLVHIYRRQGNYMARARIFGHQVGVTLGEVEAEAHQRLCLLLVDLANGSFVPPSETRRSVINRRPVPLLTLRQLCDEFLKEKKQTKGPNLVRSYLNRLQHILEFAEQPANSRRWKLARDINRDFAIALSAFLMSRTVTPNGRPGARSKSKLMSPKMTRLCSEALIAVLNWAKKPQVRKLPADYYHPFTEDILGREPSKDPLRSSPVPIEKRIQVVGLMNHWQLVNLTSLLVIPTRFEDISGAVITDFDLKAGVWKLGSRFGGSDFNKGQVNVVMPLPPILIDLLRYAAAGRGEGPMFLQPKFYDNPKLQERLKRLDSRNDLEALIQLRFGAAGKSEIATPQGRKVIVRKLIHELGAVSTRIISSELKPLFAAAEIATGRAYDIRHAVTEDMNRAGMSHLASRYFTLHTTNDILNTYAGISIFDEMAHYFDRIAPLIHAIECRAHDLGIPLEQSRKNAA
ncbi:hypothetical protein LBMAG52_16210 [Planctomycetia bacterium]|nr:hypothetical protein LBMAG52_16210 [Planctomycetia bacterium]